jgi:glycosyltransferase involved in cell wall biosynthesis
VEQGVIGLVAGLRRLASEASDEYTLITLAGHDGWIAPYAEGFARLEPVSQQPFRTSNRLYRKLAARAPWLRRVRLTDRFGRKLAGDAVPESDGTVERLRPDVVHFTFQRGFRTDIPSIYQPWDLQHVHLPGLFSKRERELRDATYGYMCRQAALVVVASRSTRADVIEYFSIPPEKVHVIPVGPLVQLFTQPTPADLAETSARYGLPKQFALFPAQTFPHKNHVRLLEALALLRDRKGLSIDLVCAGRRNEHFPQIERRLRALRLEDTVRFLDYIDPSEMPALYRLARSLVFPSRFEGWGMPIHEAFYAGTPVCCSTASSLPEVAGDAAVMFDPDDTEAMANAIEAVWLDEAVRSELIARGHEQLRGFSLERTARAFRARYRLLSGVELNATDRAEFG